MRFLVPFSALGVVVVLLSSTLVAAQSTERDRNAAEGESQQTAPTKGSGKSGSTGWSGSLGGANIAKKGAGTRNSEGQSESAQGLDPTQQKPAGRPSKC